MPRLLSQRTKNTPVYALSCHSNVFGIPPPGGRPSKAQMLIGIILSLWVGTNSSWGIYNLSFPKIGHFEPRGNLFVLISDFRFFDFFHVYIYIFIYCFFLFIFIIEILLFPFILLQKRRGNTIICLWGKKTIIWEIFYCREVSICVSNNGYMANI